MSKVPTSNLNKYSVKSSKNTVFFFYFIYLWIISLQTYNNNNKMNDKQQNMKHTQTRNPV